MTTTLKLSNSQRVLLSVASSRTDGLLVFPKYLRRRTTDNLEQAGLIEPVTVTADDPMWSEDGNARSGYRVTIDGLLAIGIAAEKAIEIDSEAEQPNANLVAEQPLPADRVEDKAGGTPLNQPGPDRAQNGR